MKYKLTNSSRLWALILTAAVLVVGCKDDDDSSGGIANEIALAGPAEVSVVEGDGTSTVEVTYSFAAAARNAGSVTVNVVTENLAYDVNYSTTPVESGGSIPITFVAGDESISFTIAIIDDEANLPDGSATFTLASIEGENANISEIASVFKLNIQDNEGESITFTSEETVQLCDVIPGTNSDVKEVTFETLNVVSDMTATASAGFQVSSTMDGEYAATATIAADATSVFVRASPDASATFGELTGTLQISVSDVSAEVAVRAVVSEIVGQLIWAENFDYPTDDTYPAYEDTYPDAYSQINWGTLPVSAIYRANGAYNGSDPTVTVQTGLERSGSLDTWYVGNRLVGIAMGNGPLTFSGYPDSGVGRTAKLGMDYSNQRSKPSTAGVDPCSFEGAWSSKNSLMVRRIAENGSEITSGNLYVSALITVNELFDENTPVLKNAVFMLTGDGSFVNENAMKLNIQKTSASTFNFGVSKSGDDGTVVYGTTEYNINTTYAVVLKLEINEDAVGADPNDVLSVYVFEDGSLVSFEDPSLTPEATITNSGEIDIHDVSTGIETFFFREVADVNGAGGASNIAVHDLEFSGIRIATTWSSLFKEAGAALYDNQSDDILQTKNYGQTNCDTGGPEKLGNTDK